MFFLLFIIQGISDPYSQDYKAEGFNTLSSTQSPARITLTKGLALMMVSWPDAELTINIPNVLVNPVKLTSKDGYSLFTFANSSVVEMKFSTEVSYFVIECPQFNSYGGAIQFCSNLKQNQYSISKARYDLYYSVFGPYTMKGSISLSLLGSATLHFWVDSSTELTTSDLSPLKLPTIRFTSALIRSKVMDSISYDSLVIQCTQNINPTVPTNVALEWSSVTANQNNFLNNMAYGGIDSNIKQTLISDIPTEESYSLRIVVDKQVFNSTTIEVDIGKGKSKIQQDSIQSKLSPFIAKFYMTYGECKSKQFKTVNVNEKGVTTVNIDFKDIPSDCFKQAEYKVKISLSLFDYFTFGSQIDDGQISEQTMSGGSIQMEQSRNTPFTLSLYIKYKNCVERIKFKEISIIKIGTTTVSITENDLPDECIYSKNTYYVDIKNDLSSKVDEASLIIKDRNGNEVTVNRGSSYTDSYSDFKPFTVQVYIKTKYCEKHKIQDIIATDKRKQISFGDSLIPNQCLPYMICISTNFDSDYSIGYKETSSSSSEIIPINNNLNLNKIDSFEVQLYLLKSPSCKNNVALKKYTAQKSFECKTITLNDFPSECLPVYYEVCFDISNLPSKYKIFYRINDEQQMSLLTDTPIRNLEQFRVTLYLSESPGCSQIELKTYEGKINPECIALTESDIPNECREDYKYISIKNSLTSIEHTLYVYNQKTAQYIEINKGDFYNETNTISFNVNVFMRSQYCSYTLVKSIYGSKNKNEVNEITDLDIPFECKPSEYSVCAYLNQLPTKYKIEYSVSFKSSDEYIQAVYGENKISYNHPFSIKAYLTESPGCNERVYLGEIEATQYSSCIFVTENDLPSNCTVDNISPNEKTQSKGISVPLIAGISGAVLILVIAAIVIVIFVVKRKKDTNQLELNSQTLGNSLLSENLTSKNF